MDTLVKDLERQDIIKNKKVADAMRKVDRADFIPEGMERSRAYEDRP